MRKLLAIVSVPVFLIFSGFSVWGDQGSMSSEGKQSQGTMEQNHGNGSSIESQNPSSRSHESDMQKGARPGEAGEEGDTSIFGSPSTMPPGETAPQHEGAEKQQEDVERRLQEER